MTTDFQVTCCALNCLARVPFGTLLCSQHTAERRTACRQPPENPMCGLGSHRFAARPCEVCRREKLGNMGCKPCTRCHFCGDVHAVTAAA